MLTIGSTFVRQEAGALVWEAGLAIDCDGAPRAYHPDGKSGLDYLGNAGKPGNWWGLVCDTKGNPIVQGPTDPAPGFYVSSSSLVDKSLPLGDPRRYVDASTVPYLSTPKALRTDETGVHLADLAMVAYWPTARLQAAILADSGPPGKLGEGSPALAQALGIPSSPRDGGASRHVAVVVFPGSRTEPAWPRDVAEFQARAEALFAAWGGVERLRAVLTGRR